MKKILIMSVTEDFNETAKDLRKLFGFKVTKVRPCEVMEQNGDLIGALAYSIKTSKKNYGKFLETRERYGF